MYVFLILFCSIFIKQFKKFLLPDLNLYLFPKDLIKRFSNFNFFLITIFCFPYWLEIGFVNTGLYNFFIDPNNYYFFRESSLKLAESSFQLKFYLFGSNLKYILLPFLIVIFTFKKKYIDKLFTFLKIVILILITNINGSKAGFITPFLVSLIFFYFTNTYDLRIKIYSLIKKFTTEFKLNINFLNLFLLMFFSGFFFFLLVFVLIAWETDNFGIEAFYKIYTSSIGRIFGAKFLTGVFNIFAIEKLEIPITGFIGGFPGASYLFNLTEHAFSIAGKYYNSYFYFEESSTWINTSGLFLNIGFFGVLLGTLIFYFNVIFNILITKLLKFKIFYLEKYYYYILVSVFFSVLSILSFYISSSVIGVFPFTWLVYITITYIFVFLDKYKIFKLFFNCF
ncbi:hypothetical protein EU91_1242 [Prochlorococcus marinus str. GP2]|uniref:Uncharacterized protein n=2 Tax=Prochlorococcus marinus TaxID=1219 RepID=A0A0A1ZAJ1_PROMR|nr:hypothetical protein EU91_1242 [Prochlorococcus marinus str. GP2]